MENNGVMDKGELINYILTGVISVLGLQPGDEAMEQDKSDVVETLDGILDRGPLGADFDYGPLRESIAMAVCVKVLARRGDPVTYAKLERIGNTYARPPWSDALVVLVVYMRASTTAHCHWMGKVTAMRRSAQEVTASTLRPGRYGAGQGTACGVCLAPARPC